MADTDKVNDYIALRVFRLPDGGYMIMESVDRDIGHYTPPLFACTSMKEALEYIKSKIGDGR